MTGLPLQAHRLYECWASSSLRSPEGVDVWRVYQRDYNWNLSDLATAAKFQFGYFDGNIAGPLRKWSIERMQRGHPLLPFPTTYFEAAQLDPPLRMAWLAKREDLRVIGDTSERDGLPSDVVAVRYSAFVEIQRRHWCPVVFSARIACTLDVDGGGRHRVRNPMYARVPGVDIMVPHMMFVALLGALNVRGAVVSGWEPDERLVAARARAGRAPIFRYSFVDINKAERRAGRGLRLLFRRLSPAAHDRRSHLRRLADGREITISETRVGDPRNGFVKKDYRVFPDGGCDGRS